MNELIKLENIKVNQEPSSWQESIRIVGKLLLDSSCIDEEYIDAMIDAVTDLGPYIVIGKHIAIAHAAPEKHVKNNGLSCAILSKPIEFGSQNDPVKVLFAISSVDGKSHMNMLMDLAKIIGEDDEVVNRLSECKMVDSVYDIINGVNNGTRPLSHREG